MKTTKLQTDVSNFVLKISSLSNKNEQIKATVEMRKNLESELKDTTVRGYLTAYRSAIKDHFGENCHLLKFLRLRKEKSTKIVNEYSEKIRVRTEQNELLIKIKEHQSLVELATELLSSDSYLRVSLGLMLVSGRRSIEILKTACFEPVQRKKFEVVFCGQVKLKERKEVPYKIPLLAPATTVIKALQFVRSQRPEFSQLTDKELNSKCAKNLNDLCKLLFSEWLGNDCSPHDLRKAYAAITYYNAGKKGSFKTFASNVLGHSEGNELTTYTYFKYTI